MKRSCLSAVARRTIRLGQARGFSLIEILLSLVLGLIVLAGIMQVYLSNQQTTRYLRGMANVQENGRFAVDLLARNLRMAGYDDPDTALDPVAAFAPTAPDTSGLFGIDGASGAPDTLITRFEGGNNIRDCLGNLVAASTAVQNTFTVDAATEELVCATRHSGSMTITTQPLATGIENLRVWYGEDTDGDLVANRYVTASGVGNWANVISLRMALLVNSEIEVLPQAGTACLGCITFAPPADRRLRGEFTTTVGLRNL
ncbi:MAG: prepilin-type N-terminal cleavage/methylation domain-containing protein [Candidatus Competibacteraceae bacterium]|nr:MAG: prepilin-type N-terminal cleavage/methylation domain-containing protein [Candidatus Competibacteraceae bacterium]